MKSLEGDSKGLFDPRKENMLKNKSLKEESMPAELEVIYGRPETILWKSEYLD